MRTSPANGIAGVMQLVVQGVKRPLAVGEREYLVSTDVLLACYDADSSCKLVNMALHAHLANQQWHIFASMRAGSTLVVAQ